MLMTEWHWLLADHIGLREVRRALNGGEHPEENSEHEDRAKNTEAGERIGAWMKDLGHTSSRCPMRQRGNLDHPYIPWKDKGVTTPAKTYCRAVYHLLEACHVKKSAVSQMFIGDDLRYDLPPCPRVHHEGEQ